MAVCRSCGSAVPGTSDYCIHCGAPVGDAPAGDATVAGPPAAAAPPASPPWTCPACSAENSGGVRFCHFCGSLRPDTDATVRAPRGPAAGPPSPGPTAYDPAPPAAYPPASPPPSAPVPAAARNSGPSAGRSRGRPLLLLVALIFAVAVGGGLAFLLLHDRGGSPGTTGDSSLTPTPTPSTKPSQTPPPGSPTPSSTPSSDSELAVLVQDPEGLARQAGRGRDGIARATSAYASQTMSRSEAAATIQDVIDNRQSVLDQLRALPAPSDGAARQSRDAFIQAMRYSIAADQHYLAWVNGHGSQSAAGPDNDQAGYWKNRFVTTFNRLAARFGQRHDWTVGDI